MNAAACPPEEPTWFRVTAGFAVASLALEYSVATVAAPLVDQRSAVPWNCIVWPTMPAPGGALVSIFRYSSLRSGPALGTRPSRPARLASGRIAIRLPPPLTHAVSVATSADVSDVDASTTTW